MIFRRYNRLKQKLTVGTFKNDISTYSSFRITKDDPFSPLSIRATFKRIIVNNSASPYVVLQNDSVELCISHIKSIQKQCKNGENPVYTVVCQDYLCVDTPFDIVLKIET